MKLIDPSLVNERILAIDIGKKGGTCLGTMNGDFFLEKMPETDGGIANTIQVSNPDLVVFESVHIFGPQRGGECLVEQKGVIKGICATLGVKWVEVNPKKWIECYTIKQKKNFSSVTNWKKHLIEIAAKLKPSYLGSLDSYTADAFLLWNYQAHISTNTPLEKRGQLAFI